MSLARTPPPKTNNLPIPQEIAPPAPKYGVPYSKEKVAGLGPEECQWLFKRQHPIKVPDDELIDYENPVGASSVDDKEIQSKLTGPFSQMNVDVKGNHPTEDVKPSVKPLTPAPPQLHSKVNVGKILKAWPNKDCPKFKGTPGEDARDWLVTMEVLLEDRQAHIGVWNVATSRCLSGKAFRNYKDAVLDNSKPKSFTDQSISDQLNRLFQSQNETCQEFYERFRDWQTKAKTYGYQYDEKTTFVKKLIRGQAMEHDHKHRELHPVASTSGGGSGKRQSDGDYGWDRKKKSSCLACYNCKKEGHVLAKFPEPKTDCQKAWEAKHAEEKAIKKKKRSQW
ncbi:uncharacterized protein PGTG_21458 [Puccinia graminis f. sp. tritici CRL 75-36-700-3]|uniref:Uncharacterized protein n=1 Tax=Puccinia graminis f. sp. tritici (strain CRL 75-36-700-3 / race SCCL) TaxID=418459 RepID=H6QRH9_PUCGT|nr:uncharacterized protein PGTG_21458 [Puccinia graminis f. sp. tritici CRL 75-36-700-3]EHS63263.1 hypothetical protein PGTG_21458 [Puccinia graminis f. sp. tritici CRL 75-36-700-3]